MNQLIIIVILALILVCLLLLGNKKSRYLPKIGHQRRITSSEAVLIKINKIIQQNHKPLPAVIAYLRKIDPLVFEELLLSSFQRQGYKIKRNQRYTGDGGIDGHVWVHGQMYLLQAKRYKNSIKAEHLEDFAQVIAKHQASGGFFIHTGTTLAKSKSVLQQHPEIKLLSGQKLVDFLRCL
ncbi:restriction endonuclease [Nostoc sp. MS1]|uniref:restriction endonuclease n=1 Tax=Nostoc sp. MS1 TaxID=2764711 RepID=UPI001CC77ED3|nr:restriction endonuclease [Nostoc sp. MS1]